MSVALSIGQVGMPESAQSRTIFLLSLLKLMVISSDGTHAAVNPQPRILTRKKRKCLQLKLNGNFY